jgi:outer membrane protein W
MGTRGSLKQRIRKRRKKVIGKQSSLLGFTLTTVSLFFSVISVAHASELDGLVTLKGGIYSPQQDPVKDFGSGLNGEISFGGYYTPNSIFELGVGYFETEGDGVIVLPGGAIIPADVKLTVIPVTASIKWLYPSGSFEPYVEAGAGVYVADTDISGGGVSLSDRYTNFGVHLGLGANFDITKRVFIGVEGRYLWMAEHKFKLGQGTEDVELDGVTGTINLGYRFGYGIERGK